MASQEVIEYLDLVDVELVAAAVWRSLSSLHFTVGLLLDRQQAFELRVTLAIFALEVLVQFGQLLLIHSPGNFPFEVDEGHHINQLQSLMSMRSGALGPLLVKLTIFLLAEDEDIGRVVVGVVSEDGCLDGLLDRLDQHAFSHLVEGLIVYHAAGDYLQHISES